MKTRWEGRIETMVKTSGGRDRNGKNKVKNNKKNKGGRQEMG